MNIPMPQPAQIELFILIFLRVSAIIVSLPLIGNREVPFRIKGALSLAATLLILPSVEYSLPSPSLLHLIVMMTGEVFIGLIIGFSGRLLFEGVQLAGQLIGFQMGFAIVNVVDPLTSSQVSIVAQLQNIFAILIFLSVNGHHAFLYSVAESYRYVPPLGCHFSGELLMGIVTLAKNVFIVAVKTGAPIIVLLLLTSAGLGVVARTVPQINIFIVGFPLKIALGLMAVGLSFPFFYHIMEKIFADYGSTLRGLMKLMT